MRGFKQFIMRGNVLDLAVAVVIGGAISRSGVRLIPDSRRRILLVTDGPR